MASTTHLRSALLRDMARMDWAGPWRMLYPTELSNDDRHSNRESYNSIL